MYRKMSREDRASQLAKLNDHLDSLEHLCVGPYMSGSNFCLTDSSAYPHFVFMTEMLPRYFGWPDVFADRAKLKEWWQLVQQDDIASKVSGLPVCCAACRAAVLRR